jgi:hypothetical protein
VVTADGPELVLPELELPELELPELVLPELGLPELDEPVSVGVEEELPVPVEPEEVEVVVALLDVVVAFDAEAPSAGSCPVASCAKITPHTPRNTPTAPPTIRRRTRRMRSRRSAILRRPSSRASVVDMKGVCAPKLSGPSR